ncbi:hypothetical protein DY000_02005612 [Brassica cretica]|uniref:Uncharacterized protein n=1 Tax=Brassica cretica TaxID=69181 RepID=A0ABQ7C8R5_BRACR|nr:hypothetical protein DY000_02005612 [Brassica cretica]
MHPYHQMWKEKRIFDLLLCFNPRFPSTSEALCLPLMSLMLCCVAWSDEEHVVPPALDLYWFFIFSKEMSGLHSVLTPRKLGFFARRPPPEVYRSRCLPPPSKPHYKNLFK